jgi:hypothetical protein
VRSPRPAIAEACRAAGLDRRLAYRWRARDSDFARSWKEAAARGNDLVRGELMERALIGRERIVYRYRPTAVHQAVRREIFGSPTGIGVSFSDTHFKK